MTPSFLIAPRVNSPWWPLSVAQLLGRNKPAGVYQLPYEDWLLWRYAFGCKGEGFQPAPAGLTLHTILQEAA